MPQTQPPPIEKTIKHWVDRLVINGKVRNVKVAAVARLWNELVKHYYTQLCEKGEIDPDNDHAYNHHPLTMNSLLHTEVQAEGSEEEQHHSDEVKQGELILEYSEHTRTQLLEMIPATFKLFWDGSLSPQSEAY